MILGTLLLCSNISAATSTDSSELLFDDAQVVTYKFSFYIPDWADSMEYYKELPDEPYMPAKMVYYNEKGDSIQLDSIGIRYKGNSSYQLASDSPKKPIKVRFDKYRSDQEFYGVKRLNFSNFAMDPSFMREKISYDIARAYMPAPRTAFANIYLEEGHVGFYLQIEQVDKKFLKRHFSDNDGNLYKAEDNGATLIYRGQNQSGYKEEYSLKTNESADDWSSFINLLSRMNSAPSAQFAHEMGDILDISNCIYHLVFTMVLSHFDSYTGSGRNFYLYDDPTSGRFSIIPWDLNLSFGGHTNNWNVVSLDIVNVSNLNQRPLNRKILENDSLRQIYYDYLLQMMDGPASYDSIASAAEQIKELITEHVQADPNKFFSDSLFLENIERDIQIRNGPSITRIPGIKSFITARSEAIRNQIAQYAHITTGSKSYGKRAAVQIHSVKDAIHFSYSITRAGPVQVFLYSMQGESIRILNRGTQKPGHHRCSFASTSLSPGFYTLVLQTAQGTTSTRVVLLR